MNFNDYCESMKTDPSFLNLKESEKKSLYHASLKHDVDDKSMNDSQTYIRATSALNLIETAAIAKEGAASFPSDELVAVAEFLDGSAELHEAVKLFNQRIKAVYLDLIREAYIKRDIKGDEYLEEDLKKVMHIALRGILKMELVNGLLAGNSEASTGSLIKKTRDWKDLESEF